MRSFQSSVISRLFPSLSCLVILFFLFACSPAAMRAKKSDTSALDELKIASSAKEAPAAAPAGVMTKMEAEKSFEASGRKAESRPASPPRNQEASGLKAGYADDNKQFNYFTHFLEQYGPRAKHFPINITERIQLKVVDAAGKPVPNAEIKVSASGKSESLAEGKTYSDGTFFFFPSLYAADIFRYQAAVTHMQQRQELALDRQGSREIEVKLAQPRVVPGAASARRALCPRHNGEHGQGDRTAQKDHRDHQPQSFFAVVEAGGPVRYGAVQGQGGRVRDQDRSPHRRPRCVPERAEQGPRLRAGATAPKTCRAPWPMPSRRSAGTATGSGWSS